MSIQKTLTDLQVAFKCHKSRTNTFGNYKYRSAEDILEEVKKQIPSGYNIFISDDVVAAGNMVFVKATVTFTNGSESVISTGVARQEESKKGMDAAQVSGAASSYARKYALNGLLLIDDTKDADTDEYTKQNNNMKAKQDTEKKRYAAESYIEDFKNKLDTAPSSEEAIFMIKEDKFASALESRHPDLYDELINYARNLNDEL